MSKINILFLFPDQHRYDWAAWNENADIRTPNLERLCREGVRFTQAVTPSPLCSPARACVAAGREYEGTNVFNNGQSLILNFPNVYRMLRDEAGYHVTGCGKFDLAKPLLDWGGDGKRLLDEYGFSDGCDSEGKWDGVGAHNRALRDDRKAVGPYCAYLQGEGLDQVYLDDMAKRRENFRLASFATPLPDEAYGDNWVGRKAVELIENAPEGKPWFLQVNFPGPHDPWDITESMEASVRGRENLPAPVQPGEEGTPEEHLKVRQNYTAMVENIDAWIGRLMDLIESRGELDNTLIVYASDHGEMLGDHGKWAKHGPEQPSVSVPLVVWGPGFGKGETVEAPATIIDVAATFLEAAGLTVPEKMDSRSLRKQMSADASQQRKVVFSGLNTGRAGDWRMVFDGRYKMIAHPEGPTEAYDLAEDPAETDEMLERMPDEVRQRLLDALKKQFPHFIQG
ncbi:MAG: sulfatase [Candidatus Sumerlaeota bacterium]